MRSRLAAALTGLVGLLAAGLVTVAAPAQATNHIHATVTQPDPVCEATWKMRGWTGTTWAGPPEGSSVTKTTAKLVKPGGDNTGVEFAAFDLDVEAPAGNELLVGVKYELDGGASAVGTAIRMFGYAEKDGNTETDAPDYGPDIAQSETGGVLVIKVPAGQKLGTLGLTYDASNTAKGSVKFSQMEIGNRPVWFTGCPEPEPTATPTANPTAEPTQTATPGPGGTETPNVTPTAPAPPRSEPTLPVTGSTPLMVALAGMCVLGAGGLLYWLSRRRQVTFKA